MPPAYVPDAGDIVWINPDAGGVVRIKFHPQAGLGFLVQLPNCECGHVSNDSIASIGCKEAPQRAN